MDIAQLDIFGNSESKDKGEMDGSRSLSGSNKKKFYPVVTLASGINDLEIQNDFVLIHRILQRRLKNNINENISKLLQTVYNEMLVKSGRLDAVTVTRTSLLMCFTE